MCNETVVLGMHNLCANKLSPNVGIDSKTGTVDRHIAVGKKEMEILAT